MGIDPDVQHQLERTLENADSWHAVYIGLRNAVPGGDEHRYRALIWAFAYDLVSTTDVARREPEGSPFGAAFEFEDGGMSPRLSDVPEENVDVWSEAYDAIDDVRLRSRIGDLL
jgi:hypothetical protein